MKKLFLLMASVFLLLIVSACSGEADGSSSASDPIELKLGTKMPADSSEGEAFDRFAELVKEKSNGEVIVKVYPAEQLGKGTSQIDNMVMGTQDMYADGPNYFADYDPRIEISSVPFLFRDFDHYQKFNLGEMGQEIYDELVSKGIRFLNTERNFVSGPYRVLVSTTPVKTVEDLQGLKLRSFESEFYSSAYKSVGANPTVVAWTETYLGMNQNLVNAATSPMNLVWPMKFTEVAPYVTVIDEYPRDIVFAMNEDKFSSLSEEHQQILMDASNQAGEEATAALDAEVNEHIELMKKEHGIEIFEIDKEKWAEAFSDYHYQLEQEGKIPEGYIDAIKSIE